MDRDTARYIRDEERLRHNERARIHEEIQAKQQKEMQKEIEVQADLEAYGKFGAISRVVIKWLSGWTAFMIFAILSNLFAKGWSQLYHDLPVAWGVAKTGYAVFLAIALWRSFKYI